MAAVHRADRRIGRRGLEPARRLRDAAQPGGSRAVQATLSEGGAPWQHPTRAGVVALQRLAGNRATTAAVQATMRRPAGLSHLQATARSAPTVQRDPLSFVGDVAKGAASYVGDVGRGFKRSAKGLRVWDPDALVKMHEENASAARLLGRLVSDPRGTVQLALAGVAGGLTTYASLPDPLKKKATDKFAAAAPGIVEGVIAKVVGKALAQKAFVVIANRILTSAVVKRLLAKLGASAAASKSVVGAPLAVFSSLGLVEKAAAAADRLRAKYPAVYRRLAADDLHMLWFAIDPHITTIVDHVHATVDAYIDRTQPDGRVLVDWKGRTDREPVRAGPDRAPIRTGGDTPRVPIRSGGGSTE